VERERSKCASPETSGLLKGGEGEDQMVVLLYFCAPSPGSFVLLGEFMLILRLSFKSSREVDSYLGQLWMNCKASDGNQLEACILAVYMYVELDNKSSSVCTQVTAYASHL